MTSLMEESAPTQTSGTEPLSWYQVEEFFREHGCVIDGAPELRWYRESWGAMERAGLTGAGKFKEFQVDQTVVRLRVICLLAMYLGIYQVVGEHSELGGYFSDHLPCSWYLDSLNAKTKDLWELAHQMDVFETDVESYKEDNDTDELLYELAIEVVNGETDAIFEALVDHYGGKTELFVSIWRSRTASGDDEPLEDIVNTVRFGDGKLEVWAYVDEGMTAWWLS